MGKLIKFVYFDVGGVLEKDFSRTDKWQELQNELGIPESKSEGYLEFWKKYEKEVCKGRNLDTLVPLMESQFEIKFPPGYSLLIDGFVNRFEYNPSIWPVVEHIHQKCRIGMLTNMYPGMLTAIHQKKLTADRKRYYSLITAKKILRQPDNQDGKLFYTIPLIMKNQAKNYSNFLEICLTLILKYLSTPLGT